MNWKLIGRGLLNKDMRTKVFAVFGILIVYRMLAHVPIPLAEPAELKQILDNLINTDSPPAILTFLNILSGGALASLSIMLIGLGPYINASIIIQVLQKAIPKLETLANEGEYGKRKLNQYTRMLTFPLAIVQSIGSIFLVRQVAEQLSGLGDITANASLSQWVLMVASLTAGALILMWLGELITEKGIGNGISILITVGIVSQLPFIFNALYEGIRDSTQSVEIFGLFSAPVTLIIGFGLIASTILTTLFVVYLNEAQRRIKISYAKKVQGNRAYSDVSTVLPVKLIAAGVIPIIFAVAFLSVPQLFGQLVQGSEDPRLAELGQNLVLWFTSPGGHGTTTGLVGGWEGWIYPITYFSLVVAFTYFYTGVVFNSKEISEQLQRQGGFIEGVRPGKDTEKYLTGLVNRLNLFGASSLGFLALTPIIAQVVFLQFDLNPAAAGQLVIGGTSILILVAVALDTLRQIESKALMVTYEDYDNNFYNQDDESTAKRRGFGFLRRKK